MAKEVWKDIEGFPGYQVSDHGRVRNKTTGTILRPGLGGNGYYTVALYKNKKGRSKYIHELLADAFIGKREKGMTINHKDGDKTNNDISNLEIVTYKENLRHAYENGLNKHPKPVKIVETGETFDSLKECANAIGGHSSNIVKCLNGELQSHKGLHFKEVGKDEHRRKKEKKEFLYPHQRQAIDRMFTGCILNGGTGSGKSRTALFYYFQKNGGWIENQEYTPMRRKPKPPDLYIITTAKKRNDMEWEQEMAPFLLSTDPELNKYYGNKVVIDSWQNIKKYKDVTNSFFIFDEDKLTGKGVWARAFLKIAKTNEWIILSASPGDKWEDFATVFIANGFFKNRTEFSDEHLVYSRFSKFPNVTGYRNEGRLIRLRNKILIDMDFERHTIQHHEDVYVPYDIHKYKEVMRTRWDPYKDQPIEQPSGLCYVLRRIVNEDEARQVKLLELFEEHPQMIIFYNFDSERDILLNLYYGEDVEIAEYSGHSHQKIPESKKWVYIVQYTAGCEGWNSIKTDTIVFYSQNYSYKVMLQATGRIDRLNTPFQHLYYFHLKSRSGIDLAISRALSQKKKFNERTYVKW